MSGSGALWGKRCYDPLVARLVLAQSRITSNNYTLCLNKLVGWAAMLCDQSIQENLELLKYGLLYKRKLLSTRRHKVNKVCCRAC